MLLIKSLCNLHRQVDGKWAWLVAVCACLNAVVIDGIGFSGGILFENLARENFTGKSERTALSVVNSVNMGVYLGSGRSILLHILLVYVT